MNKKTKIVICCGINRSGSTWSYQVCKDLLGAKKLLDLSFVDAGQLASVISAHVLEDYDSVLIKMHAYDSHIALLAEAHDLYHIYTHRDIRGCLYSLSVKTGRPIDKFIQIPFFEKSVQSFSSWQSVAPILYIPYIDIMKNAGKSVAEMIDFLDVTGKADEVAEKFSVDKQKKRISNYTSTPAGFFKSTLVKLGIKPIAKDDASLLHSNHINTKIADEWKDNLTVRKAEKIKDSYSEWMNFFNYV